MEKVVGILEIGWGRGNRHIIINRLGSNPDPSGVGHIILAPRHARYLANLLVG
jgi:hypothetical protein